MPTDEATYELDPFNKPFSTDWYLGGDMESTDALGYRYTNWCFRIPPIRIWELVTMKVDPWVLRRIRNARLVIRSSQMARESVELRAFINQPRASHRTKIEEDPSFAGTAGAFGMGDAEMKVNSKSRNFDLELNVTDTVRRLAEEDADEMKLKIMAIDANGEPVDRDDLPVDEVELIIE